MFGTAQRVYYQHGAILKMHSGALQIILQAVYILRQRYESSSAEGGAISSSFRFQNGPNSFSGANFR